MSQPMKTIKCMDCKQDIYIFRKDGISDNETEVYTHKTTFPDGNVVVTDMDVKDDMKALCNACILKDPEVRDHLLQYQNNKSMTTATSLCTALTTAVSLATYMHGSTPVAAISGTAALIWSGCVYLTSKKSDQHLTALKKYVK